MRLLIFLLIVALLALVVGSLLARSRRAAAESDHYRVIETTSGDSAHVFVGRGSKDSTVLIGSIPVNGTDFDDGYATLIAQAEDRVATLNASRELREGS